MLADPNINLTVFVQNANTTGTMYAYEVSDACEADQFGYSIDNILLSDFVFPSWFESFRAPGSTQFDQQAKIPAPLQLLTGGYIGVFDISAGSGWQQQTADKQFTDMTLRGKVGSRRERRRTPREQWVKACRTGRSRAGPGTTGCAWRRSTSAQPEILTRPAFPFPARQRGLFIFM